MHKELMTTQREGGREIERLIYKARERESVEREEGGMKSRF